VRTYGVRDYNEHAQNWSIAQDAEGLLYFGNNNGLVLTYDGHVWRSIRVAESGASVRGLEFDRAGRLWVGASGDLGYLEKDGRGGFVYTSLRDRLPSSVRERFLMYHLAVQPDGVFFFTFDHVFRWDGAAFHVEEVRRAWPSRPGDRLLRHAAGRPLEEWRAGKWQPLLDAAELRGAVVRFAAAQRDGALLLATERHGLFLLKDGELTPWATECDAFLKSAGIERGLRLRDGGIVLSHRPQGFSILESDGRLRTYLSEQNSPLPTSVAWAFHEDRSDNLWVALDTGVALVLRDEGITYIGQADRAGRLNTTTISPFRQRLYIGTPQGLLRLEPAEPERIPPRPARLQPVPEVARDVRSLHYTEHELLIASPQGLETWQGDGSPLRPVVSAAHLSRLWISRLDPTRGLAGGPGGVYVLERTSAGWQVGEKLTQIDAEIRGFSSDTDGSLWLMSVNQGFYRIVGLPGTPSFDGSALRIEHYGGGHGLASERIRSVPRMTTVAGRTRFLDQGRFFEFDAQQRRFVQGYELSERVGVPGAEIIAFNADTGGTLWVSTRRPDGHSWPARGRQVFRIEEDRTARTLPFRAADFPGGNFIFQYWTGADGREIVWVVGTEGLVRVDVATGLQPRSPFRVRITHASDSTGQSLALERTAKLSFDGRALTLRAATDRYGDAHLRYQTRVADAPWSDWSDQATHAFERLPIGSTTLSVRARDSDGIVSEAARFSVIVLPPWWLTWWAFAGYVAVASGGVLSLVRWRSRSLSRRNAQLEALVDARTAALRTREDELKVALEAAEAANRAKSAFLASMSHELRTPLNAILGYAQILRHAPGLGAEQRRQLDTVHASGDHLLHLINDVLDLAKIEAGKVELNLQPMSLSRLLAHLTEVFEPRAAQRNLAWSLHGETALPDAIIADEARLRQVLYNLLGNALKFTERGRVELRIGVFGTRIRFAVVDTGIGIAPAEQVAIFGLFHQAAGPALSAQGAGLGLAISQRLVRLMGSEINVSSSPGEGSRFSFDLPLSIAAAKPTAVPVERVPIGYRGPRRRVLVVDDEAVNREVLRALLAPLGFMVEEAETGEATLERVAENAPELILMDIRLRGLDGLETTRRLRAQPNGAALRIIAISASVFPIDRDQAIAAGCDDFEPKPFRAASLLASIGRWLGLEWEWPAAASASPPPSLPDALPEAWPFPPLPVLNELDVHADLGDLAALRACIKATRSSHTEAAAFLDALDTLAANAHLAPLRSWINRALQRASAPTP
jgi:signal transduction histidine kinase/CheY-like chemotaxis protein